MKVIPANGKDMAILIIIQCMIGTGTVIIVITMTTILVITMVIMMAGLAPLIGGGAQCMTNPHGETELQEVMITSPRPGAHQSPILLKTLIGLGAIAEEKSIRLAVMPMLLAIHTNVTNYAPRYGRVSMLQEKDRYRETKHGEMRNLTQMRKTNNGKVGKIRALE